MPKKRFSWHISSIFGQKKSFYKIGLRHILGIAISNQCEKFYEKIWSTAREIQEMPFSGEKRLFRGFLESSGKKKSVLLTIEPCLMVGIVINNIFEWKNNEK